MANEPSILDVADEEFAQINKPEQKQEQGSILDIADDEFKKQEEESTQKEFDVTKLEKLKAEGKPLSEVQQRMIFDEQDKVPLLEQAAIGLEKFIPAAAVKVGELSRGAYELAREGVVKPVYVGTKYHLGLATPKETNIAARGAEIAGRSAVSGVMSDLEDTAGTIIKGYESGSAFTDKLQGLSADERFKRYRWRETFSGYEQARREETPDRAAAVLSENVLLQKAAGIAAKMQGGTEEEAKEAEKAYSELVLESGLTREELNPYISAIGEVISPISIPGANIATKGIGKYTSKAVKKGGELALKGVVKPIATGVEKAAELTEKGITGVQTGARKLGEYVTGDPDTLIRGGSIAGLISAPQITGTILAAKPAAIATKEIARTFKDIASAVDVGGAAGRRGLVERAGRAAESGVITKKLFSAESRGGLGRARAADWMIRQGNAITQQGVNGAVLNTILGLPDIESIEQGFEAAGSGFGIGAFTGSRIMERAGAVIDPRTGLAQKIDTIITPDPSSRRADEDADIKRFLSSVDPDLVPKMEKLGSIDERKKAIQSKVDALEKQKNVTFGPEVELIKKEIIRQKQNIEKLDKSTPQTQKEILRQIHLAFADEMDLAKTTGKAAGLNNIQVKILDPSEMEGFFRNSYGATLTDAESVIASLTGKPDLSPQESENLINSRRIVDGFYNEIGSAQSARGLAISEGSDLEGNEVPAFMRKKNLQGATIVINGDLVKQLSNEGFNIRNVVGHEMQHALGRFTEVRDMLAPLRRELFDQNIVNEDGTVNKVTQGIYSDDKLDAYADTYAASMSPSDNGESFKAQFGGDQNKLRAYIKEEILSEIAGRSGNVSGGTRAGLDSIGRQVVDWIEVNTQNGALKKIKETLRKGGIIVDDSGDISTVLGAELTPESLAMIRQYQRQLKNLNQSMVYEEDSRKEEVEIPITKILSDRTLQEKFKNSDIFEKEQVATMTAPDGSKQEIPIPPNAGVDPFVGTYRIQGGQLVDESGNPMNLGPNITFGTMPDGTQVEVGTRIARNVDGSPKILSNREIEARSRNRGKVIRNAIDSALSKGALQLEDTGNGNYRGVMSEAQVNAVLALPNTIVSPNLKRQILFVNEILRRKDGTRMYMEYQAAMRGGKSRALAPQIRDEIPIGFQFSKQGNFLITTMSVSRMHDKMNAWLAKKPENLKLWNGDTASFWDDVIKVLDNHSKGERGETGLDPDAAIALEKKNAVNDLFNVWNADTKAANPRRTKLPVQKGKDPIDVIVRARRIDRINQYNESSLKKMPFNYELNTKNYMPAENPLADFQTPEDFANELPSVTAEEIRNAINTGNLDQVESRLREGDDLKPAESLDEKDGNIRIVSMFDNEFMPQESLDFVDVKPQFMPAETERYPTSERGMYSGLQKTIDQKVQGKFASPDQLKAIVTNPQNAKAEELKWSGVLGEIDRLAAENQGKVPKDKVMDYLRNEGAVKFEEVTLGQNNSIQKIANEYRIKIEDEYGEKAFYDEFDEPLEFDELPIRLQDAMYESKYALEPKHAKYQLSGGENYREVVMTMPIPKEKASYEVIQKGDLYYPTDIVRNISQSPYPTFDQANAQVDRLNKTAGERTPKESYTSSHFPETPNYVAHMRLNERTDAQGNEGDFIEEFQSDRHQAGREKGYRDDARLAELQKDVESTPENPWGQIANPAFAEQTKAMEGIPDAPFRKDWSIQLFKRALRDAVDSGKSWIGWTTGDTQAERYDLSKQVDQIAVHQRTDMLTNEKSRSVFIQLPIGDGSFTLGVNNNSIIDNTDASSRDMLGKNLADVVGKEMAQKIMDAKSGTILKGNDLKVGGEGMRGFYDQILPKEIGKYVAKMGGKVEKSEIETRREEEVESPINLPNEPLVKIDAEYTPIWRVSITPEMAGKVRGGQLQFMPADSDYLNLAKDPEKNREQLQGMVDVAAKGAGYTTKGFHRTPKAFNEFILGGPDAEAKFWTTKSGEFRTLFGQSGRAIWFGSSPENLPSYHNDPSGNGILLDVYLKNPSPLQIDDDTRNWARDVYADESKQFPLLLSDEHIKSIRNDGYTGIEYWKNGKTAESSAPDEMVVFDPTQIKSADPVTYDDNGNAVPLSQRFNPKTSDIRFMPEQPTEYEPISARIRPLQGISAPTKVVGAKALSLGEIEPPVRGKAMLPDMELKPIEEKQKISTKIDAEKLKVSIDQPFDEFGDIDYDAEDAVRKIAKDRNLGVTSDRELAFVAKDENGEIVGGAFTSADQDGYTFDVVVSKEAEGKGVGSKLLDEVINPPYELMEAYPDAKVKVDVVNPSMKKMLENRGFVVEEKIGKERWIMVPKKPDISEKGIQSSDKTGLQFMPASPVTKTQTGYDYTYLDEALKNGKNGKVALTRPVRADEALPLLSQRIPITNQVDRNSFDYLSPAEVEFYQYENNPVSFKFDPALLKKPVFKDAAVEHAGKNVQLAMADRQTASGGDMGGIMFPWLKSNIDSTVIGDDGIEYRAVWGNQEWKPVLSMKNKNKNFNAYNLLTYLMGPDAHASNTREVRTISNEIENAPITREQKDLFLILSNIGVKKQKTADQQKNIKSANKVIEKTKTLLSKTKDQAKINKLNKIIQTKERNINIAKSKLDKFVETINEELLKKVITKYKTAYTRFKNKTGNEVNLTKNLKELNDFKKTKQFKDLIKLIGNKQLISLDNTFKGRKAAIAEILGLTIDDFNVDNILDQTMDFKNGRINQIVGSIELSRNPELMAVYLGNDPKQAKRMTPQEAKAAAQLKANSNFVPHEAYAWAMLGPVNGNHFLNSNPKTHLEYFADFKEAYANIQATADKKKKILEGNETTLMGAMRDNTQMPLAMPKISSKK